MCLMRQTSIHEVVGSSSTRKSNFSNLNLYGGAQRKPIDRAGDQTIFTITKHEIGLIYFGQKNTNK